MRVLIVDDSAVIRDRLREALRDAPGAVVAGEARDAVEAWRLFLDLNPDLVILDIGIPRGNGIDVLRAIKGASPETVVVMYTNYADDQYRVACVQAGADFFCDKLTDGDTVVRLCSEREHNPPGDAHGTHHHGE